MQVAVTGASGLVGSALVPQLSASGDQVRKVVRGQPQSSSDIRWDPQTGEIDRQALSGCDAVVHLAGENIAAGRWTAAQKERILTSRVQGTQLLAQALISNQPRPRVWVCASAIGFYGDRSDEQLDETSRSGEGFLADVCRQWEAATKPAADAGIRVVNLRFGVILSPAGGALKKMLLPFKLGLGGRIGSGQQYMSWIALQDVVGTILHALTTDSLSGPTNTVAPQPVTNLQFTKTLGHVLKRPTLFPVPAPIVRVIFGEMGDELLLSSTRVQPARLMASGYPFRYPELEPALRQLLSS